MLNVRMLNAEVNAEVMIDLQFSTQHSAFSYL